MLEIARDYPDDIGVMGPLYLNTVRLAPGEAMYLSAGVLHAYLRGTGIELMANSDNVLRGGCTSKQIDVTELLRTTRFVHETPEVLLPGGGEPGFYRSGAREFRLSVCDLDQEGSQASDGGLELPVSGPLVLLLLTGAAEVFDRDSSAAGSDAGFALSAGHSCFVTGTTAAVTVRGRGRLYIAGVMEGRA